MYVPVFVNCFFSIFIQYAYFDPSDSVVPIACLNMNWELCATAPFEKDLRIIIERWRKTRRRERERSRR